MLHAALEAELAEHCAKYQYLRGAHDHQKVVRNGYQPERTILTGAGTIPIRRPRVDDRILSTRGEERFSSRILPKFMRRAASIDSLIPVLNLEGISSDDFSNAKGLSATTVVRLKEVGEKEYEQWTKRDLSAKHYVYMWTDGV
jgi:hypothetical protein